MNVPEEVTYLSDDEFDWDAAVAEIDKVHCNLGADQFKEQNVENVQDVGKVDNTGIQNKCNVYGSKNDPKQPSASRLNCARQKTLESFFDGGPRKVGILPMVNESAEAETTGITLDQEAIKTWIYPANVPRRDYQFSISQTALFTNTLVSLPTGLGKTLIAAVVMYNFFRWFPDGKIVFTAPSRPLVIQQIEACHNIMGISQEFTIDMTGQMNPVQRVEFWQNKRVYFVTPQILEKDIQSGICPKEQIICLVVDEAHRASGNYSYCVVVRELMAAKVKLRILALTATPGSKQAMIQAVVDNLHISCLEYRDENDPDVCQYTHNRKLELIQVIMNAESNTVRGMFLEVMQPIVYKICSFGVFYSKDVARLTPYEFVTAREKFRQAPPPTLAQSHYGEIEGLFGVAITLYHIYKLLFSHGLRPAFEMLQQKLQQGGPFAKLMGRNTQLMEIKRLMQQIIVHGAPSPKLEKMNEIIMQHFRCQDPASTRIIIFTNFRESVKDIMESLANHSDTVKAMEFIGQSSGKCSKGQTQKTQQAVLQKFRTGGYNVLVATSIGEEGLDIMEVDLVICFDANVSPLRMIQRMGRTGRKRDGRVVVLASEGAELQGYLKKQAKNQALGKHMSNGGLRSFNFHSSPRMVPHVYKPEAQFIEISVKQFVPRGRKAKGDSSLSVDGIPRISEEEKLVLAKYFDVAGSVTWTPSLIAFPKCQLIPTPVYKVKHSCRTTSMLIDALQGLQGQPMADFKRMVFPSAGIFSGDAELSENEKEATKDEKGDRQDIEVKILDPGMEKEDCNEDLDNYCYDEGLELNSNIALDSPNVSNKNTGVEKAAAQFHNDSPLDQHLIGTPEVGESPSDMCKEYVIPNDGRIKMMDERMSNSLHRCRFSNGIVQVSAAGRLSIASPPKFPFEPKVVDDDHVIARTPNKVSENEAKENFSPNVVQSGVPNFVDCSAWSHWQKSVDFVAETPEQIVVLSSPITETLDVKAKTPGSATANMLPMGKTMCDRSDFKRLDNEEFEYTDANKLYGRRKFSCQGANRVINYEVSQAGPNGSNGVTESKTPSPAGPLHIDKIITKPICGRTGMQMLEEFNLQAGKDENSFQVCSPVISSVQKNNSACLTAADCGSNKTPLAFHRAQHLHYRKIDASSCKPRKLKRLRRVRELTSPDAHPRHLAKKKGRTNPNLGLDALQICKQRLKMVQPFIDEEAEVSTDEAPSSDDENDDSDDAEELQGFINDSGEPTPARGGEAIDMMAIYRRSLLSQSPASSLAPWMHLLPPNATSGSSSEKSAFSNAPSSSEAAGLRSVQNISVNPDINASTVLLEDSLGPKVALSGAKQHPSGSRQEIRKRKLSFQLSGLHVNSPPEIDMHANMARSNLEETLQVRSMPGGNSSKINVVTETEQNEDLMEDNLFDGLDLDALEADAVQKLSSRHMNQVQNGPETKFPALHLDPQSLDVQEQNEDICFPSFDLGIED